MMEWVTLLLVIDETTGLTEEHFLHTNLKIAIKLAKLKKRKERLSEYIEKRRSLFFHKDVNIVDRTLQEEIDYFTQFDDQNTENLIVYFYDPSCTAYEKIRRLRNVLLPDNRLYPLPVTTNLAETCFLIDQLDQHQHVVTAPEMTYERFRQVVKSWLRNASSWLISTNVKSVLSRKKRHKIYRQPRKDVFHQVYISPSGQIVLEGKDSFSVLWKDTLSKIGKNKYIWMITKGVELSHSPDGLIRHVILHDSSFPAHVPYIQLFLPSASSSPSFQATLSQKEKMVPL